MDYTQLVSTVGSAHMAGLVQGPNQDWYVAGRIISHASGFRGT